MNLPFIFHWYSINIPFIFHWSSINFPLIFHWSPIDLPFIFHSSSSDLSLTFHWFSIDFSLIFHWYSIHFPFIFHCSSIDIPLFFHCYSIGLRMILHYIMSPWYLWILPLMAGFALYPVPPRHGFINPKHLGGIKSRREPWKSTRSIFAHRNRYKYTLSWNYMHEHYYRLSIYCISCIDIYIRTYMNTLIEKTENPRGWLRRYLLSLWHPFGLPFGPQKVIVNGGFLGVYGAKSIHKN